MRNKKKKKFTPSQQNVIGFSGQNMLVSASAGTGKTTVMIERIATLIENNHSVDEMVVVTFTNLAAAEMKARLAERLAEKRKDSHVMKQLELLDSASICTLHSFCSELLRNYFYVVDVDPAYTILDDATVTTLQRNALDELFAEYFVRDEKEFNDIYKIFSTHRREENFREIILRLYAFSRCLENFGEWYDSTRETFLAPSSDNLIIKTLMDDVTQMVKYCQKNMRRLADNSSEQGYSYAANLEKNAGKLEAISLANLDEAMRDMGRIRFSSVKKNDDEPEATGFEKDLLERYAELSETFKNFRSDYVALFQGKNSATKNFTCKTVDELWCDTRNTVALVDKLVDVTKEFEEKYFQAKKQRGGLDYDDLEHLCLKLLQDEPTRQEIQNRYKFIFVDEYQDTNPIQEAIVNALYTPDHLFMVGDVKQSIYSFRGCEPSIFVEKYDDYKRTGAGYAEELNDNFRSNREILDFVNVVFNLIMTPDFGKVDYKANAQLKGTKEPTLKTPSVRIDVVKKEENDYPEVTEIYDVTKDSEVGSSLTLGEVISRRIKQYIGKAYVVEEEDERGNKTLIPKRIEYGDIVILTRAMTEKATEIYNTLIANNIPVTANFKIDGLSTKEIKDLVNLLRVLDNPYVDVSFVGAALAPFGGFSEAELGLVRLNVSERDVPFCEQMQKYAETGLKAETVTKTRRFLDFLDDLRFYSRSASVDEIALKILRDTNYHLYVQGLPNGDIRLRKLYAFIDGLKGAPYSQSVDKFLSFVDETENSRVEEGLNQTNAVRLMTMHASKGLEFPIVFVAGIETPIQFDKQPVEQNSKLGVAIPYYDFGNMTKSDTLGHFACKLLNHNKQREEEMRLLYVAMTRAKFVLNVVAVSTEKDLKKLPPIPSKAKSQLDWVLLAITESARQGVNLDYVAKEIPIVFGDEDNDGLEDLFESDAQPVDGQEIEKQLAFRYGYAAETTMPTKVVSSALASEYVDVSDEPQNDFVLVADADRNFIGTAYHKLYQYLPLEPSVEQIRDTLNGLVANGKIEERFAEKIDLQLVYDTLRNPELVALLKDGEVYHEKPFMLSVPFKDIVEGSTLEGEVMLQGVIDLLVLKQDSAVVIDFKYTTRSDKVKERYTPQLNSYKLAVERICGISNIDAYVLSIADNKLIKM